jgi:hypothetical protein
LDETPNQEYSIGLPLDVRKSHWETELVDQVPKQVNSVHYNRNLRDSLPTVTNMPENAIPLARISNERTSTG